MVGEGEVKEPFPYRRPHPIHDTQGEQKKVMEGRKTKRESETKGVTESDR